MTVPLAFLFISFKAMIVPVNRGTVPGGSFIPIHSIRLDAGEALTRWPAKEVFEEEDGMG